MGRLTVISISEFEALKREADKHRREADRATGALEQLKASLKPDSGCKSVAEAEKMLERLLKEQAEDEENFDEAYTTFRGKFDQRLA